MKPAEKEQNVSSSVGVHSACPSWGTCLLLPALLSLNGWRMQSAGLFKPPANLALDVGLAQ